MNDKPAAGRSRSLTQQEWDALLFWIESKGEQGGNKYLEVRSTLVRYFVRKGCTSAEEQADNTLDRVAAIVHREPETYPNVLALCCGVARRVWQEYLRKPPLIELEGDDFPAAVQETSDFSEQEMLCLESCLGRLTDRDRDLITRYHQYQGSRKIEARKDLAQSIGGLNKLRITAYRIRVRLHECVSGCAQRARLN